MRQEKRLFCSKPFTWFEVSEVKEPGEVFVCCPSWLDRPIGNLLRNSVAEIWNGPTARELRRSILDGSFSYCNRSRCPYLQSVSGPVQPVEELTDPELKEAVERDLTVVPWGPREIVCCYDKSCNLSCPSCRTGIIMETENKERILNIQGKLQAEALAEARVLYITGSGDPFGSPFFRKWLQTLRRADMPLLQTIHLHTNGLLWTNTVWETIPPEVRELVKWAEISIDAATAETYATNRRGGRFERLLENLEFVSGLRRDGPLEWFGISMVVQENNFPEMADFVRLGKRFRADTVYFSQLVNWSTFSDVEFAKRAVHSTSHPHHAQFLRVLRDPLFEDPLVYLGNLTLLRAGSM